MLFTNEIEMYRILLSFAIGAIAVSTFSLTNMFIPDHPVYNRIRKARALIATDYIAILIFNFIDFVYVPTGNIIPMVFVMIGMYQTLFLGYALAILVSPIEIKWTRILTQATGITALFIANLLATKYHPEYSPYPMWFTFIIYYLHLLYYSVKFFRIYHGTLHRVKDYLAEEEETRMTWVKNNFIALIILSVMATCSVIDESWFYAFFIMVYVCIYSYIATTFIKRNHKYTKVLPTVVNIADKERQMEEDQLLKEQSLNASNGTNHYNNFSRIAFELDRWVSNKGFLKPDVTIDQILFMLDTTRPTLRAFMNKIYGMTFSEWRNEMRLDYAYHLLREHPEHTIGTVTKMVGFNDEKNFCIAFRKKYLIHPKDVRHHQKATEEE